MCQGLPPFPDFGRQRSGLLAPASDSFRIAMICSSLNRFRFLVSPPGSFYPKTHSRSGPFYGGKVTLALIPRFRVRTRLQPRRHSFSIPLRRRPKQRGEASTVSCVRFRALLQKSEGDFDNGGHVHGLAVAHAGVEAPLPNRLDSLFVKALAQRLHHLHIAHCSVALHHQV